MQPAVTEKTAPSMKLHSSPTHAVLVPLMTMWSRFFMKLMTAPYTGPSANAPSRAGRSEKSILTKDGMSIGMGNSMNIRIKATALSMAATVKLWVVFFFMVISSRGGAWPRSIELESPFRAVPEPGRQPKTRPAATNTATGRVDKSYCLPFLASGLYRWPRSLTGSALFGSGRGLYRQWGIAPRPETNFLGRV